MPSKSRGQSSQSQLGEMPLKKNLVLLNLHLRMPPITHFAMDGEMDTLKSGMQNQK